MSLLLAAGSCALALLLKNKFLSVRKNDCARQKELVSVHIISKDEIIMNGPKNIAINSTRDKENTPAYQVRVLFK